MGNPEDSPNRPVGALRDSIIVGTKLTKSQAREAKREDKYFAEVYVGTADPVGIFQEFGTAHNAAQPFMRPAWEANSTEALVIISTELKGEIEKSAARLDRKAAKLAGG